MEQNLPIITKKVWNSIRAIFFMLKKGIFKRKFLVDLNMLMKRGKIAGKASAGEYEFSCRNSPPYPLSFFPSAHKKLNKNNNRRNPTQLAHVDDYYVDHDDIIIDPTVIRVLDHMLTINAAVSPSPVSGFGMSPMVSQGGEDSCRVDEAADKFIRKFYNNRRSEN